MSKATGSTLETGYDVVGRYHQDQVNGFSDEILDRFLDLADLAGVECVLDAMGGDGNLTLRLIDYCRRHELPAPRCIVLEYSQVQCEFARDRLEGTGARVVWGDALGMTDRETGEPLPSGSFDRVLIKSANHEIPLAEQPLLYAAIQRVLRPGGRLVNLGFLFDDARERDEFRAIAKVKDELSGMTSAAERRHFLTRSELYPMLAAAGFADVRCGQHVDYAIHSHVVEEQYFKPEERERIRLALQVPQLHAMTLRENARIRFDGARCIMRLPGEMTVAHKPAVWEAHVRGPRPEGLAGLRGVGPHAALLQAIADRIPEGAAVLDLGCADGALWDLLEPKGATYRGIDPSPALIAECRRRCRSSRASFQTADLEGLELPAARFDVVVVMNGHDLPGVNGPNLLRAAFQALRPEGRLMVFGPATSGALDAALSGPLATSEGAPGPALREAAARYLAAANGWSAEGMAALLDTLVPCDLLELRTDAWGGLGWLAVAQLRPVTPAAPSVEQIFHRSLVAHLPASQFQRLQRTSVLVAGLGGGSNIAELLARKGIGRLLLADLDRYEAHNVRQRGSAMSTLGRDKAETMRERLLDVNPHLQVVAESNGVTLANVGALVRQSDIVVDMIDYHGIHEKVALYREARRQGKFVVTAPSIVNGGMLYVFHPEGITWERFFDFHEDLPIPELGVRMLRRLIPRFPAEAPESLYRAAARGERTIPLDAVGVDQAAVLAVAAVENLALERRDRLVFAPRGILVDASDPAFLAKVVDFGADFAEATC